MSTVEKLKNLWKEGKLLDIVLCLIGSPIIIFTYNKGAIDIYIFMFWWLLVAYFVLKWFEKLVISPFNERMELKELKQFYKRCFCVNFVVVFLLLYNKIMGLFSISNYLFYPVLYLSSMAGIYSLIKYDPPKTKK